MKENLIDNHWNEFLVNPLNVVDRLYNQMNGESSVDEFHNFIKDQLISLIDCDASRLNDIPYLNNRNTSYDNLKNRSLVRYRCMVQDMFNPEIYAAILGSQNGKKINLYTDSVFLDEKYFLNPAKNHIGDRFIYYMISIPGVNEWVKDCWDREGKTENVNGQSIEHSNQFDHTSGADDSLTHQHSKRHLDDETGSNKKKKLNEELSKESDQSVRVKRRDYCTPIKKEESLNKPIICKVYDTKELEIKLNDIVEVIGIIEFPSLENRNLPNTNSSSEDSPEISSMLNNLDLDHEDYAYSELPRIHALHVKQLNSINPSTQLITEDCRAQNSIYNKLINVFEKIFFGDKLTTQYFICWLVSRVYKIQDSLPIGNFPINISNLNKIPNNEHSLFISKLYEVIESLCTHSLNLPITIAELNNRILNPYKDRDSSKLQSGLFQLPTNFSLIIDETSLQPGSLKEMGLKNLSTIKDMIAWQSLEYDHLFYTQKINTDINVLVLSEGKSLFEVSCEIKLTPVNLCLDDKLKEEFRTYLNYVRSITCDIPTELQKKIQDDFVQMRRSSSAKTGPKICADDLHRFLALSRLLAMSEGSLTLDNQHWERAKSMELERRSRTVS